MADSGLQNKEGEERGGEGRVTQQRKDVRVERDFQNAPVVTTTQLGVGKSELMFSDPRKQSSGGGGRELSNGLRLSYSTNCVTAPPIPAGREADYSGQPPPHTHTHTLSQGTPKILQAWGPPTIPFPFSLERT
jgi:hypothetical protein